MEDYRDLERTNSIQNHPSCYTVVLVVVQNTLLNFSITTPALDKAVQVTKVPHGIDFNVEEQFSIGMGQADGGSEVWFR